MGRPMMLLAYDAGGVIVGTLDYLVAVESGEAVGLVDFAAHEAAGGKLRDVWDVQGAVGSGTWPEWLGARAHEFAVELDPSQPHRIGALRHVGRLGRPGVRGQPDSPPIPASGQRRERAVIEQAIAERIAAAAEGKPADIRDIIGGPDRPLRLDGEGRTVKREPIRRPALPMVGLDRTPTRPVDR